MSSDELVKKYANNRIALREIKREIDKFHRDSTGSVDLNACREMWIDQSYRWHGWVAAVEHCGECSTEDQMKLAVLLDRKKSVERASGYIKRSIYLAGINLIKKDLDK